MQLSRQRLKQLLEQYVSGQINAQDAAEMLELLQQQANDSVLETEVMADAHNTDEAELPERHWQHIWTGVQAKMGVKPIEAKRWQLPVWLRVAAVLAVVTAAGAIWWKSRNIITPVSSDASVAVIPPGTEKAVLTLSDGSTVLLDSTLNGSINGENGIDIRNTQDGSLSYQLSQQDLKNSAPKYNTLTTPRGGIYRLTLADGTGVWLNAASSITFPVAFAGAERRVSITGEAYFEVASEAAKPFKVEVNGMVTEVLGTSFNIMSYADEDVLKTTLVTGLVRVSSGSNSLLLRPGEQLSRQKNGEMKVQTADMEEVLSWKNGLISFSSAPLPVVMRRIARWYDVELVYEGSMPKDNFNGIIDRNLPLQNVLKVMKIYGVKYKLDGKKLTLIF